MDAIGRPQKKASDETNNRITVRFTDLNEQIYYTGQYLANKGTYHAFLKAMESELSNKQKALRSRYYSAKNAKKEMYAIKRNVDNVLKDPNISKSPKKWI